MVSTVLFAGAHLGRLGRASAAHLLTGAAFGSAYVATGRLHAAIAAHGTYNVLVGTAALASERVSKRDTGRARGGLVASVSLSRRTESTHQPALMPRNSSVATLEGVGKAFGAVRALAGVDLELRRGEIVALLGPNGAGKSTAVAIMLGLRRPDEGRATLFGFDPRDPVARRRAGAVLQEIGFLPAFGSGRPSSSRARTFPVPSRPTRRSGAWTSRRSPTATRLGCRAASAVGWPLRSR